MSLIELLNLITLKIKKWKGRVYLKLFVIFICFCIAIPITNLLQRILMGLLGANIMFYSFKTKIMAILIVFGILASGALSLFDNDQTKPNTLRKETIVSSNVAANNSNDNKSETSSDKNAKEAVWKITASSTLNPEGSLTYDPILAMDNNNSTAWVEGAADEGVGEWIMATLPKGEEKHISAIDIYNGYQSKEELYYANNRVKQIRIDFSDGTSMDYDLQDDTYGTFETIVLPEISSINWVKITVLDVYPGNKYNDTCIAELSFY